MKSQNEENKILQKLRQCLEKGNFVLKAHQKQRERERNITRAEVLYVLKRGHINSERGGFDLRLQRDKYAIWGRTIDGRALEIIVAFDQEDRLEIITTYDLEKNNDKQ